MTNEEKREAVFWIWLICSIANPIMIVLLFWTDEVFEILNIAKEKKKDE